MTLGSIAIRGVPDMISCLTALPERAFEMAKNERTSKGVGSIASRGLKNPGSLTKTEIKKVSASALTQRPPKKS
jgi:hypothetical protein